MREILEEAMRRAFYDEFQADIPIKREVIIERIALFDEQGNPRTDAVTETIASTVSGTIGILCGCILEASSDLNGQWCDQTTQKSLGA